MAQFNDGSGKTKQMTDNLLGSQRLKHSNQEGIFSTSNI